jgi:hypothetical protein
MNEASRAIQKLLDGKTPKLNHGATAKFIQKIVDFAYDNLDYIKLDKNGKQIGIDEKVKKQFEVLIAYADAHNEIAIMNAIRMAREKALAEQEAMTPEQRAQALQSQPVSQEEMMSATAQPGEGAIPAGTLPGTSQQSSNISATLTPGQPAVAPMIS